METESFMMKYFEPTRYTACIKNGPYRGLVGDVIAISNQVFSITKAGLAWVKTEAHGRICVPVEFLERV